MYTICKLLKKHTLLFTYLSKHWGITSGDDKVPWHLQYTEILWRPFYEKLGIYAEYSYENFRTYPEKSY